MKLEKFMSPDLSAPQSLGTSLKSMDEKLNPFIASFSVLPVLEYLEKAFLLGRIFMRHHGEFI